MALQKIIQDISIQLGIPFITNQTAVYTIKDGFPIQFFEGMDANTKTLWGIIRFDDETKDKFVKDILLQDKNIEQTGLKPKKIDVTGGIISLKWPKGLFGYPKPDKIVSQFTSVFTAVKPIVNVPGRECRVCGSKDLNGAILVDGLVDRMCPACVAKMQKEVEEIKSAYEALPTNIPLAIIAALVIAIVGAALWAGLIVGTQRMYWIVAIGIGVAIGWGVTKAAGKGGLPVQAIAVVATVLSILMGLIFYLGYAIQLEANQAGQSVNWVEFVKNIPSFLLKIKGDAIFSLGGGLIGSVYAAIKAGKPKLDVKVEKQ